MEVQNLLPSILRSAARLTSLLSIGLLLLFLFGEGERAWPAPEEWVGLLFFPVGVAAGLALAWWREAAGAAVAVASFAAFYFIYGELLRGQIPRGPWFIVFTSPAVLFFASWLLRKGRAGEGEEVTPG